MPVLLMLRAAYGDACRGDARRRRGIAAVPARKRKSVMLTLMAMMRALTQARRGARHTRRRSTLAMLD